jgi:hypothetical protein
MLRKKHFAEDLPMDVARSTLFVGQRRVYRVYDKEERTTDLFAVFLNIICVVDIEIEHIKWQKRTLWRRHRISGFLAKLAKQMSTPYTIFFINAKKRTTGQ